MRGRDHQRGHLGGYVDPEAMVPPDHPLRQIRPLVNAALARLSPEFDQIYSLTGRPSVPPEQLLRALLLQAFFTVRSERQLMEQLTYNPSLTPVSILSFQFNQVDMGKLSLALLSRDSNG
jgi:transposase